jgi:hypothetical protein
MSTVSVRFGLSVLIVSVFFVFALCMHSAAAEGQIGKEEAAKKVLSSTVERIWEKADKKKGLRVNQYGELLPKGAVVRPAFEADKKKRGKTELECKNACWLFFIDEDPLAHFAHPVRIAVVDAVTGEQQEIAADWWPQINDKPVFDTIRERTDPKNIIFNKVPASDVKSRIEKEIISGKGRVIKSHDSCNMWAVIVCGYDDLPDTFDEDTDGMYNVLRGLGVPDDHIFFVSPHTGHAGVDVATSIANVQWAINQVAAQAGPSDKVLFFYSSHGNVDSLSCVPGSPGGGSISGADLSSWLGAITSQELTIVIEACHSGSLIGRYADGTYVAAEDNLTGNGETNRAVFTSASSDTSSYADVDWAGDPNPGDSGSETIWGYVEAFSTAAADTNGDGEISFGEAWQYAWNNDITRIDSVNTPQMVHTALNVNNVYNYCYSIGSGGGDLFVSDGPGDVGHNSYDYASNDIWVTQDPLATDHVDVVSGMDNYVHVTVHNRGASSIANGSLKVYWGDVSTAMSWPADFHQIGSTTTFGPLAPGDDYTYTWTWNVDPAIGLGHHFCLIAVSDSPANPMTGGPAGVTYVAPFDNNIGQKNITIVSHSHGKGAFDFVLRNNTKDAGTVDLVVEWVGDPWGNATLILPEDLMALVKKERIKLDNLRVVELPKKAQGVSVVGKTGGRLAGIPLKPGESRIIKVSLQTNRTAPGQRSDIRLRQETKGAVLGAVTARMQAVSPFDCDWVTKNSVEAFADLAHEFKIDSAKKVSRFFAGEIRNRVCGGNKYLMEVLSKAQTMESDVLKSLPRGVDPDARKAFGAGMEELKRSIKEKNVKAAVKAQGAVSEAVTALTAK